MKSLTLLATAAALSLSAGSAIAQAPKHPASMTQVQLARQAKIPAAQARAIAVARVPGAKVRAEELERENGKLIYSYDLTVAGKSGIEEVNVDAMTGKVVAMQHEGAAAEKAEAKAETKVAAKAKGTAKKN